MVGIGMCHASGSVFGQNSGAMRRTRRPLTLAQAIEALSSCGVLRGWAEWAAHANEMV